MRIRIQLFTIMLIRIRNPVTDNDWILLVSGGLAIQHLNLLQNILLIQLILVPAEHTKLRSEN
jgi:hypothetical protein